MSYTRRWATADFTTIVDLSADSISWLRRCPEAMGAVFLLVNNTGLEAIGPVDNTRG